MIKFTTKDIIDRARQIADLQNTDFISYEENMNLLNEAYTRLYQLGIDNDDKNFFKIFNLKEAYKTREEHCSLYELPDDFYQLYSITVGTDCTPILRKNPNEPKTCLRYDIIENNLVIYGDGNYDIEVLYYPIQQTLSLRNDDIVNTTITAGLDVCKSKYLIDSNTIYDASKDTTKTLSNEEIPSEFLFAVFDGKTVLFQTEEKVIVCDIASGKSTESSGYACKANNKVYVLRADEEGTYELIQYYGITERVLAEEIILPVMDYDRTACISFSEELDVFYLPKDNAFYEITEGSTELPEEKYIDYTDYHAEVIEDHFYSVNYDICEDGAILIGADEFVSVIGFNERNTKKGYGVSVIDEDGQCVIKPIFIDTYLNFPNNFYLQYMAYLLAISYKIKQGASVDGLSALAQEAQSQFYSSMSRDNNQVPRVKRIY